MERIYDSFYAQKVGRYFLGIPTLTKRRARNIMLEFAHQVRQAFEGRRAVEIEQVKSEEEPDSLEKILIKSTDGVIDGKVKLRGSGRTAIDADFDFDSQNEADRRDYEALQEIVKLYIGRIEYPYVSD